MELKSFLLKVSSLSMSALLLSACGGSSTESSSTLETTQGVQNIYIEPVLSRSTKSVVQTQLTSESALNNVPMNYYLLSNEANEVVSGDVEVNSTTISSAKAQYNVGTVILNTEGGSAFIDSNITIGNNIPVGNYRLAVHINPLNEADYKDGDIYISEDIIEVQASAPDIAVESYTLDDDIFIVDNLDNDILLPSTIRANSITGEMKNINVQACLEFQSQCIALEFLVEGNISHAKTIVSLDEVVSNISTTLFISQELKKALYAQLDSSINDAYIKISLTPTEDEENFENNTFKAPLSLYKLTPKKASTRALVGTQEVFKNFTKGFDASKNDSLFGITFNSGAEGNFGSLYSDAGVTGLLAVKVLGAGFTLLSVDAKATVKYDSFADTGYNVLIQSLGVNIYSNSKNVADAAATQPEVATLEGSEADLSQEEQDKILAARQAKINSETQSALSYTKAFTHEEEAVKEQTILVGIVPVVVKAGAIGTLGFKGTIELEGILLLSSKVGPTASLAGFASGGVGVQGFSAGVQATFTFIENDFRGITSFGFEFSGDSSDLRLKGILSEQVVNTFGGPNGSVDLYAEYMEPKICDKTTKICKKFRFHKGKMRCKGYKKFTVHYPCGITTNRPTLNIFKWDSDLSSDTTLLDESETLIDIKLY